MECVNLSIRTAMQHFRACINTTSGLSGSAPALGAPHGAVSLTGSAGATR
jgi:hypothetical protein